MVVVVVAAVHQAFDSSITVTSLPTQSLKDGSSEIMCGKEHRTLIYLLLFLLVTRDWQDNGCRIDAVHVSVPTRGDLFHSGC